MCGFRSEWRTDLLLGNTYGIQTESIGHFARRAAGFLPRMRASDTTFPIYAKNDPLAITHLTASNIEDLDTFGRSMNFGRYELFAEYQAALVRPKSLRGGRVGQAGASLLTTPTIPYSSRGFSAKRIPWFDQVACQRGFRRWTSNWIFSAITRPASVFLEV